MLDHENMCIEFRHASSDTDMRDACHKDKKRFFEKGAWWSGSHGKQFKNKPKPEFNKLWRSINRTIGSINDMELNAVIVSNSDDATDEAADLLQKRWRNDFQTSDGVEASEIATMEAAVGGFGCTKLVAKYEDEENPDPEKQYLCTEIVFDACQSVFFDAGSIRKDKSDATRGWHLIRTNRRKIEEEYGVDVVSFMNPTSYWGSEKVNGDNQRDIYLAHYYEVVEKNLTVYDFSALLPVKITTGDGIKDEFGEKYTREDLKELKEQYLEVIGEGVPSIKRKVKYTEYALADGEKYLTKPQKMPFKRVPLFPRYGYYAVIEGQEFYCGEVRKQTDQEMFHNYFASAMMEIMAAPQVSKPEYAPEQIARHAGQRARADIDGTPFVMSDPIRNKQGDITHVGPIGMHQPPQMGSGLAAAGQFLEQNLQQSGGMGQASLPSNASGEAIQNVNDRQDDAFLPIVKNVLHSIRAQCEAWIPAAQSLYFTNQRRLRVLESDGTYTQVTTMEMAQDANGNYGPYGNSARGRFSVQVEQGQAYKDSRDAERQSAMEMLQYVGSDTEFGQMIAMHAMSLTTGEGGDNIRQIARFKQLELAMASGYPVEPENEKEQQFMQMTMQKMQQQAQMQQQNDPMMLAAQAEMMKAQAQMQDKQVDMFNAETSRMKVMVDAEKADADIQFKEADLQLKGLAQMGNMMRQ